MEYGTQRETTGSTRSSALGRSTGETETKQAFKTTEFWIFVVILLGLFIAGLAADGGSDTAVDGFGAERVWLYAVILSVGYMVSRGLAKSGSRDPYSETSTSSEGGLGDRVKAAAQVLREGEGGSTSSTAPTQTARTTEDGPRY